MSDSLPQSPSGRRNATRLIGITLALVVLTGSAYSRVAENQFVLIDDQNYIPGNPNVANGLTKESVVWAFSSLHASNWHPLTWLSHMLDVQMFGLDPSWHHIVGLLIHILNTVLLFAVLGRMTGEYWKSAFVAALFAVHPLHVESVAWAAERKDVLSTFFWMLTMWAYFRYTIRPRIAAYLPALLFFALGLLAKPMLVTLPFVLLLMDYWPLGRLQGSRRAAAGPPGAVPPRGLGHLVLEKIPFLILSAASCVMTFVAQSQVRTVASTLFPPWARISNAMDASVRYIGKTLYPASLAIFYPHPVSTLPAWEFAGAFLLLAVMTVLVLRCRARMPFLAVGWFWYLGTLVPVIGIVQVGEQAMADRYTYVPVIGLFLMLSWGAGELSRRIRIPGQALAATGGALILVLAALTWNQVRHWKDSISLFRHAVEVTANNPRMKNALGIAHDLKGQELLRQEKVAEAIEHFEAANRYKPYDPAILFRLGGALAEEGRAREALPSLELATEIKPEWETAHLVLGKAYDQLGKKSLAEEQFRETLRINPSNALARSLLGGRSTRPSRPSR